MKPYYVYISKNAYRVLVTGTPPEGAIEIPRVPDDDEKLVLEGKKVEYKKLKNRLGDVPSVDERLKKLEEDMERIK